MSGKIKKSFQNKKNLFKGIATVVFSILFIFTIVKGSPPGSPYNPGETLAPTCSPGDANCSVITPAISGDNADITSLSTLTSIDVDGGSIDGAVIGVSDPVAGTFTDLQSGRDGSDGQITIYSEQSGTDYSVIFQPNALMTQSTVYVLPPDDGSVNEVLTTDGNGELVWQNVSVVGGNNLDQAYDEGGAGAGRVVVVDSGAVRFVGSNVADETLEITNSGNGGALLVENTGSGLSLRVNDEASDASPFVIDTSGNVGIGTTIPAYLLDVYGDSRIDGNLITGNASTTQLTVSGDSWFNIIKSGVWNGASISDAYVDNDITIDLASTATALASNGANCSAGQFPLGVDASGAVESCFDVWTEAENTSAGYIDASALTNYMQDTDINTFAKLQSWAVGYTDNNTTYTGGTGITLTGTTFSTTDSEIDHGQLAGLSDDDHPQYALLSGRDANSLAIDEIKAYDSAGLKLYDDAGNGIFVDDGGNVGIGTTSPSSKLDVRTSDGTHPSFSFRSSNFSGNTLNNFFIPAITTDTIGRLSTWSYSGFALNGFTDNSGYGAVNLIGYNSAVATVPYIRLIARSFSGSSVSSIGNSEPLLGVSNHGTRVMTILGNGKVGIGTTSPGAKLEILDSSAVLLHLSEADSGVGLIKFTNTADSAGWYTGITGTEKFGISRSIDLDAGSEFIIQQNGNVGIGTASPGVKLDVNGGNIRSSDTNTQVEFGVLGNSDVYPRAGFKVLSNGSAGNYGLSIRTDCSVSSPGNIFLELVNAEDYGANVNRGFIYQTTDSLIFATAKDSGNIAGTQIKFTTKGTSGAPAMTIPSDSLDVYLHGNVGIGTTNPGVNLDVSKNQTAITYIRASNTNSGGIAGILAKSDLGGVAFQAIGSTETVTGFKGWGRLRTDSTLNGFAFVSGGNKPLTFNPNDTEQMRITGDGNVGIGTTSPNGRLHVHNPNINSSIIHATNKGTGTGVTDGFIWESGVAGVAADTQFWNFENGYMRFGTANRERVRILGNGNVGIGTTSPANKLDVDGSIAIGSYAGVNTAPTNGLIVSGYVGLNNTAAAVNGVTRLGVTGNGDSLGNGIVALKSTSANGYGVGITLDASSSLGGGGHKYLFFASGASDGVGAGTFSIYDGTASDYVFQSSPSYFKTNGDLTVLGTGNSSFAGNVGIGTTTPNYKLEVSGAVMLEDMTAPTASAGHSGIYSNGGELFALDAGGNSTQISPHSSEGLWIYNSKNLNTGRKIKIEMEQLTKEMDRMLGGGYFFENGKGYEGENIIERLQKSILEFEQKINNVNSLTLNGSVEEFAREQSENGALVFEENISFESHIAFNGDTVGKGKIKAGDEEIEIEFEQEYESEPIITLTFVGENILDANFKYTIVDKSKEKFIIKIEPVQEEDIRFNWHAFGTNKENKEEVEQEQIETEETAEEAPEEETVEGEEEPEILESPVEQEKTEEEIEEYEEESEIFEEPDEGEEQEEAPEEEIVEEVLVETK